MVIKAWELQEALKSSLKPLYVVKGNDVYFRDVVYDAFCRLINPDDADLALCVYEDLADVDSVIEQTVTPFPVRYKGYYSQIRRKGRRIFKGETGKGCCFAFGLRRYRDFRRSGQYCQVGQG